MTTETPAPLVPPEVDLRGYEFMPLYGDRLLGSQTWIGCTAEAKVAAVRLWWRAYAKEVPAASLPDNDALLADYAGYGTVVKAWLKVREQALRNFVKCSDGRLYHTTIAPLAVEAWEFRNRQRDRTAAARDAALLRRQSQVDVAHEKLSVTESTGQDRTGQRQDRKSKAARTRATPQTLDPDWLPPEWEEFERHRREKRETLTPTARTACIRKLASWRASGCDIVAILRYSIDNGYTGLFEQKPRGNGQHPNKQETLEERNRRVAENWSPPADPAEVPG